MTAKLDALNVAIAAVATALADGDAWGDPERVAIQLRSGHLTGGEIVAYYSMAPRPARARR